MMIGLITTRTIDRRWRRCRNGLNSEHIVNRLKSRLENYDWDEMPQIVE